VHRRGLAWLLALPLVTAGSLAAHELAYRLVEPDAGARGALLDRSGHAYLEAQPFLLGLLAALLVAGVTLMARNALRGRPARPAAWPFALLPVVGFAVQEHVERLGTVLPPLEAATEPTFLVGLALQLPFGLLAVAAARWLGRAAEDAGRALGAAPPHARRRAPDRLVPAALLLPAPVLLARARGRAPPTAP
jgi:hypothetical protein